MHYLQTHATPKTLGEMLAQEGYAAARAGCTGPFLEEDDREYTHGVLEPHRAATDRATLIACLYGDAGAKALGYPPHGLNRAGLALGCMRPAIRRREECESEARTLASQAATSRVARPTSRG